MNNKLPITRLGKFFSKDDFDINIQMGQEYLHGDLNMKLVLYRVDRGKTETDAIYAEVGKDEVKFFPPIEFNALVKIDEVNAVASSWANEVMWKPIHNIGDLAFDHKEIVLSTFEILKNKLKTEPICFDLLPEKFTLLELQQLYEYAFKTDLNKANFRKKIKPIPFIAHNEKQINVKHRPAKLYSFDASKYQQMIEEDLYTFKM